ncbi:hypothetical protein SARC_10137, partial [Sphaeroforma arctica JP610]
MVGPAHYLKDCISLIDQPEVPMETGDASSMLHLGRMCFRKLDPMEDQVPPTYDSTVDYIAHFVNTRPLNIHRPTYHTVSHLETSNALPPPLASSATVPKQSTGAELHDQARFLTETLMRLSASGK